MQQQHFTRVKFQSLKQPVFFADTTVTNKDNGNNSSPPLICLNTLSSSLSKERKRGKIKHLYSQKTYRGNNRQTTKKERQIDFKRVREKKKFDRQTEKEREREIRI